MSADAMGVPALYNVTCTVADTEYSQALPVQVRSISIQNQAANPCRIAFVSGKVAAPTAPYLTIKANGFYNSPVDLRGSGLTIYLASPNAGDVIEIEAWT